MSVPLTKDEARARVSALVQAFRQNADEYSRAGSSYNETQTRTEFITPLLEAFGWDVYNGLRQPLDLLEVFEEATVEVGEERLSKKPDYELRLARQRKFFVEAKKPSVHIDRDPAPGFQIRRYGFSASLPISVLTNFNQLVIYDCVPPPLEDDNPAVARIRLYSYEQFETHFDEIYGQLSREAVYSGAFDATFNVGISRHGANQFDDHFLTQVRSWRERLARDIHENNPLLTPAELTYAVQLFICRLVFLRICEDRDLERYETLKSLGTDRAYESLMSLVERADGFYDSGLFRILDDRRLRITISDIVLTEIISELYYPQSPYTFSVVEAGVLGEIYEQFLGEVIDFDLGGNVEIVLKPEVRESGGVVPTPRFIVDAILDRTLAPATAGKSPTELSGFTVADISCGSGIFLLAAYEHLLAHHADWYSTHDRDTHNGLRIYEVAAGQWRLTFDEKRRILLEFIRGVDIDANAAEVARFSLLLKLIEDESSEGLRSYARRAHDAVLPNLDEIIRHGNSLISHEELEAHAPATPSEVIRAISPFTWRTEFPSEFERGGFDVIVGNPPYIRIQNMVAYSVSEVDFYQSPNSPYTTAQNNNFDKYALFIERALSLLRPAGRLGFIVPHKFMTTTAGAAVRHLIAAGTLLEELVHFGAQKVFGPDTSNYTCILILTKPGTTTVLVEKVSDLIRWRYGDPGQRQSLPADHFGAGFWTIADDSAQTIFDRVRASCPSRLGDVADIYVGVQTSADSIFIIEADAESDSHVTVTRDGANWAIERGILRPCLHDVQLNAYARPRPNKHMIFPYRIGRRAVLIQPDEMARSCPGALAYLTAYKTALEQRSITGGPADQKQFYQFGRSQSLTKFSTPKIILPILSTEARYAYDDTNIVVTGGGNGPYYLVRPNADARYSLFYLLAVLCHPLSEAMVRTRTSVFGGGYYSHGKQFIEVLPIPDANPEVHASITTLVQETINAFSAADAARTPAARTQFLRDAAANRDRVDAAVTALFGLSEADMTIVSGVPVPA